MPKLFSLSFFLSILFFVGCQPPEQATEAGITDGTGPQKISVKVQEWTVTAADGFEIHCRMVTPDGQGPYACLILAHMLGKDLSTWEGFQAKLAGMRFASVAYDMRGHGKSLSRVGAARDREFKWNRFSDEDWQNAWMDVQAVLNKLKEIRLIDSQRVGIAGGSIGANVAVIALARLDGLKCGAALSPSFKYKEVSTEEALKSLHGKPLLV